MRTLLSVAAILLLASTFVQTDEQQELTWTCGQHIDGLKPLIKNALETNAWAWHAAIYHRDNGLVPSYKCGGTLITSNLVLTAGHCVSEDNVLLDVSIVSVALGKLNLDVRESTSQAFGVAEMILHPNFTSIDLANDIALIRLATEANFDNYVHPICLWPESKLKLSEVVGKEGTVVGWGKTEKSEMSNVLRKALLPVVESWECLSTNPPVFGRYLRKTNFCAGLRNGTGICDGDSGGSLTFEENGTYFIRGIVSSTVAKRIDGTEVTECDPLHYAIFTDVAQYLPWIAEITEYLSDSADKTNGCVKEIQCDGFEEIHYTMYEDIDLRCNLKLNIALSERHCKFIPRDSSNINITWLKIEGRSDAFPDLSDFVANCESLRTLDYENSKLRTVVRSRLKAFKRITVLSLKSNEISQLSTGTFSDLKDLIKLDLQNNQLQKVDGDLLMELIDLRSILLDENQIEILPEELFLNNRRLEVISLNENKIKIISPLLLKDLSNLKFIYLHNNRIDILREELFRHNEKLEKISIHHNKIQIIPADLFRNLPNLKELYLNNNKIKSLPEDLFRNNPGLARLEIQNNNLFDLPPNLFMHPRSVEVVIVKDMRFN